MAGKKGLLIVLLIVVISAILVYIAFFAPPTIKSTDPVKDQINVPTDKVIMVNFSTSVKTGNNFIELKNSLGTVVPITKEIKNNILTITPVTALSNGTKYTLILHTNSITDLSGKPIAAYTTNFTTKS